MATVYTYSSTDTSAPSLTGVAGSLVTVLDACLVNGYGSKSGAGWTKAYSGTSKAAYRNAGTGFYLNVDDSASGTGGAKEAFMTGFKTMSALATGTGQFPTSTQLALGSAPSGAVVLRKSNTADSTVRPWVLVADNTVFYLFIDTGDYTSPSVKYWFIFGDIKSYSSSDTNNCIIIGRNAVNTATGAAEWASLLNGSPSTTSTSPLTYNLGGHFMAGNYNGVGSGVTCGKHVDTILNNSSAFSCDATGSTTAAAGNRNFIGGNYNGSVAYPSGFPYPHPIDGGLYMTRIYVHNQGVIRGYLKGIYAPLPYCPLNDGDVINGTGSLASKSFLNQNTMGGWYISSAWSYASVLIETTSTWS